MDTGPLVETRACAPQRCCLHMERKEGVYNPKNTVCGSIMQGGGGASVHLELGISSRWKKEGYVRF